MNLSRSLAETVLLASILSAANGTVAYIEELRLLGHEGNVSYVTAENSGSRLKIAIKYKVL